MSRLTKRDVPRDSTIAAPPTSIAGLPALCRPPSEFTILYGEADTFQSTDNNQPENEWLH